MAVRDALLALLATGPRHGYQLRTEFDTATGGAWPLNVGQVYTTLQRLERDGLVATVGDPDGDDRVPYRLTEQGRTELDGWFDRPAEQLVATRDELPMKVMLALATGAADPTALIRAERQSAMSLLQDLTALKLERGVDLPARLQTDRMILRVEAEIRWLDLVEDRLLAEPARPNPAPGPLPAADPQETTT